MVDTVDSCGSGAPKDVVSIMATGTGNTDILDATPICARGNPYPLNILGKHNVETLAKDQGWYNHTAESATSEN